MQVTGEGETDGLSTIGPLRMGEPLLRSCHSNIKVVDRPPHPSHAPHQGARALVALVLPPIHQLQLTL